MTSATAVAPRVVALVGPPNAGKTSLYNHLTGSRYKTVNYPGATVDFSVGILRTGGAPGSGATDPCCEPGATAPAALPGQIQVVDTPGIVSIVPRSQDEEVAISALSRLQGIVPDAGANPDLVVVTLDATQPARHLPLLGQILDAGFRVVAAVTMNDMARAQGRAFDCNRLSSELGIPVAEVDGRTGRGMDDLLAAIESSFDPVEPARTPVLPGAIPEDRIQAGFRWADALVALCVVANSERTSKLWGHRIDAVVLSPLLGLPVFVVVMAGLFWSVFAAASPFMKFVQFVFGALGGWAGQALPDVWWSHLLVDGVLAGFGSVLVFVPQIAILFVVIGLLEDSGYLARGAMQVDRFLMVIGLNGKSFVPLLSGNACAIPAAMAARTIPGRRERMLTLLVIPLMSCSARLPVWGLLLAFLVPGGSAWIGGLALAGIYTGSLALASVAAVVGGKILRIPPSTTGFQVELPAWRLPSFRTVVASAFDRTKGYLSRAGGVILAVSVVFWAIMNLPSQEHSIAISIGRGMGPMLHPMGLDWRVGVALLAAFAAREVFVSALAVVFSVQAAGTAGGGLLDAMRRATFEGSTAPVFTVASVAGLVVFFMISLQCLSTVAVMRKEASGRFAAGQMVAFLVAAWVLAVLTVQGLRFAGVQ